MKLHILDLNFFVPKVIGSYLIETDDGPVIVDTGPESTFENLKHSLSEFGYSVEDVRTVLVTHIHLDHSGAAWRFAEKGSKIHVHPNGAKHLIDPTKLVNSAERIFKDKMKELWGEIRAIDESQVITLEDRDVLKLGGLKFEALETFGHASHHHSYIVEDVVFSGDVTGICIEGGPIILPTPPPDINIEQWLESIEKLRRISPSKLYPGHFGEIQKAEEHLDLLEYTVFEMTEFVGNRLKKGIEENEIISEYLEMANKVMDENNVSEDRVKAYDFADFFWMNSLGLIRYWKKFRSSELAETQ